MEVFVRKISFMIMIVSGFSSLLIILFFCVCDFLGYDKVEIFFERINFHLNFDILMVVFYIIIVVFTLSIVLYKKFSSN